MAKYIMALDQGTTSSRCILFDKAGNICSMAQREFEQIYPKPGWVEHNPMEIWSTQYAVMSEAMALVGAKPKDIAGIGITIQRETTIVWDKETGEPVYNAIVWQCRRTAKDINLLVKDGYAKESIDKYLGLFKGVEEAGNGIDGICYIAKTLEGFLEEDVEKNLLEIINSVNAAKQADFKLVFDPTLVRGMSYYTGTIFEIAMPELGAACGGGGRYDKMVGKFTGQDVPACGFSIGFERIVLLLMESGFTVPMQRPKVAYLIEKGYPADKLVDVIAKAQEERQAGKQVLVVRMNKNKKFQKEKLAAEGYKDIVEFFNN